MIWQLGNTTIRNPLRIRDLLIAYHKNGLIEGLYERGNTNAQAELFEVFKNAELISTEQNKLDDKAWYGRKLRLTLFEMGLIADNNSIGYKQGEITKTGQALINAKTEAEIQNIYLRILFNIELRKRGYASVLRPIPFIIKILLELKKKSINHISYHEFSLILQNFDENKSIDEYVAEISDLRNEHEKNRGNLRRFFNEKYSALAKICELAESTIKSDYPDVTLRYLKLSGLFIEKGHGLRLNPQYLNLLQGLSEDNEVSETKEDYYYKLNNFPSLPFDNQKDLLAEIVLDNAKKIQGSINNYEFPNLDESTENLELIRVQQEEIIKNLSEDDFAKEQKNKTEVILRWFDRLNENFQEEFEDEYINFDSDERPQYLEWVIWRAFLSINCLKSKSYEARKFRIDSSYKPIHHAPAGTADLVFEFDKFVLAVEVTFTTSSRQVANEGVSVEEHVANIAYNTSKPTFGLLLAPDIDVNTTKAFRVDNEYILEKSGKDIEQEINIIPLTISKFREFFQAIPKAHPDNPNKIYSILNNCLQNKHLSNREWQSYIEEQFTY